MTKHLITRGADHGVFDIDTACGLTLELNDKKHKGVWELNQPTCDGCKAYVAANYPLCVLCNKGRCQTKYCDHCCRKHFDEQKAKYPGLNPFYYDPMPGENHDNASNDYKEMYRKARDKLGFK